MRKLSPEFLLAAACCRWPPSEPAVRVRAAAVDWAKFLAVIRRQRVEGLASNALRRSGIPLPDAIATELRAAAAEIARLNLAFVAESRRLQRMFDGAGLDFLFVKGATLDMLGYGSLALKRARDIDMLIAPADVATACELLAQAGYARTIPGPEVGPDRFGRWIELCKETNWYHPATGIVVELHTDLVDNPALLPGVDTGAPRQTVEVAPGIALETLATEQLFAYLCVHGATHAWSRLKWVADVGALLSSLDPDAIEQLYRKSLAIGVGRCSAQALLLCRELFELPLPERLLAELEADRVSVWLRDLALQVMTGQSGAELDDTVLGTIPIHVSHFALASGWRYRLSELTRKLQSRQDQVDIPLPRPLTFLYPLIAVPSWLWRRARAAS
jgi:hypothetical protein